VSWTDTKKTETLGFHENPVIKRFAYYREDTVGVMKEGGLKDYLVLLSLCHTCRYRGISFLKFLLSRERDVDAFGAKGRARRRRPLIEVYPRGLVPRHLTPGRKKVGQKPDSNGEQKGQGKTESTSHHEEETPTRE
jgi:hypothetical protein